MAWYYIIGLIALAAAIIFLIVKYWDWIKKFVTKYWYVIVVAIVVPLFFRGLYKNDQLSVVSGGLVLVIGAILIWVGLNQTKKK